MKVAVISDIHSNLVALEAVLAAIGSVDAIWQLGDVVGYGPEPDAVVARLKEAGAIGVRGNHDAAVVGDLPTDSFNDDARAAVEWTRKRIRFETEAYLRALPEKLVLPDSTTARGELTLVHGSPRNPIWEYLTSTWAARENLGAFDSRWCLNGHTHVPLVLAQVGQSVKGLAVDAAIRIELGDSRAFLNPGSVGQPRDGDPSASYMLFDTDAYAASWQRVEYRIEDTQARMLELGLPPGLARRLTFGL